LHATFFRVIPELLHLHGSEQQTAMQLAQPRALCLDLARKQGAICGISMPKDIGKDCPDVFVLRATSSEIHTDRVRLRALEIECARLLFSLRQITRTGEAAVGACPTVAQRG
jgi:hypothetical protein